jgi:hypothetical protein
MPITIVALFLLGATIAAIVSAMGRCPLWVSVILLCVVVWLVTFGQ